MNTHRYGWTERERETYIPERDDPPDAIGCIHVRHIEKMLMNTLSLAS